MNLNPSKCAVIGGKIWFDVNNQRAVGLPIIVVHGGPGTPHNYLHSLTQLLPDNPIIFYDQLDCGLSDKPNEKQYWYLERFVDEIEKLRQHLEIDEFHLYSHSAGTLIAFDYSLQSVKQVKSLILSSPILSIQRYLGSMQKLLTRFPSDIRDKFYRAIEQRRTDTFEFMEAMAYFAENYLCRVPVWPEALLHSSISINTALRDFLWGSNDFMISGSLKTYERLKQLQQLKVKTLITIGQYDFIATEDCQLYKEAMPHAELAVIADASHHAHIEQPSKYAETLQRFLNNV